MSRNNLVVVTWNGVEEPLKCVAFDDAPLFHLLVFNYAGVGELPTNNTFSSEHYVSVKTENKGQIFWEIHQYLQRHQLQYNYIGIIDDDIFFMVSQFNYMLQIAHIHALDVFQPSISLDSYFSHRRFVHAPGYIIRETQWVEIMAPFYRKELFDACSAYFLETISGQGIDCFLMPCIQKIQGKTNTAIIDAAIVRHYRPIRSHARIYSNGLNNVQEIEKIRMMSIQLTAAHPQVFDSAFLRQTLKIGSPVLIFMEIYSQKIRQLVKHFFTFLQNLGNR